MRMKRDLNCWPWVRSLTHSPVAVIHSPGRDRGGMPHGRHEITVPTRVDAQNAEAVLRAVECNAFDETSQDFPGCRILLLP